MLSISNRKALKPNRSFDRRTYKPMRVNIPIGETNQSRQGLVSNGNGGGISHAGSATFWKTIFSQVPPPGLI